MHLVARDWKLGPSPAQWRLPLGLGVLAEHFPLTPTGRDPKRFGVGRRQRAAARNADRIECRAGRSRLSEAGRRRDPRSPPLCSARGSPAEPRDRAGGRPRQVLPRRGVGVDPAWWTVSTKAGQLQSEPTSRCSRGNPARRAGDLPVRLPGGVAPGQCRPVPRSA